MRTTGIATLSGWHISDATVHGAEQRPVRADVFIGNGRVLSLGSAPQGFAADRKVAARGLHLLPMFCDRLALPQSGTASRECLRAAARGGTAHMLCSSVRQAGTGPQSGAAQAVPHRLAALADPNGGMADIPAAAKAGAAGFWWNGGRELGDEGLLRALQLAAVTGLPVVAEPRVACLAREAVLAEGPRATRLGLRSLPAVAETAAVAKLVEYAAYARCRMHFAGLSCARAAQMVAAARQHGAAVTADVHAANVLLCENDAEDFGAPPSLWPPLRSAGDRESLAAGLLAGSLTGMVSAHAEPKPHERDESVAGAGQFAGLHFRLALKWALERGLPPFAATAAAWQAGGAGMAGIFGINVHMRAGAPADLMLIDPKAEHDTGGGQPGQIPAPFAGMRLPGKPLLVLRGGKQIEPD